MRERVRVIGMAALEGELLWGGAEGGGGKAAMRTGRRRWIEAARMKRVALTQANDRKQAAPHGAVPGDAGHGVLRARRLEAASGPEEKDEERGEKPLVHANERDHSARH